MLLKSQDGKMIFNLENFTALGVGNSIQMNGVINILNYDINIITGGENYLLAKYVNLADRDDVFAYLCRAIERRKEYMDIAEIEDRVIGI